MIGALVAGVTGSGGASLSSYESIATATVSGLSPTITFSLIPSGFKHLQLRITARGTFGTSGTPLYFHVRANSDTNTNYSYHYLQGNGTAASAVGAATVNYMRIGTFSESGYGTGTMGVMILDVLDYDSTTKNKTFRSFSGVDNNNTTGGAIWVASGLWQSTSAITSISITNNGGDDYTTASSFALYGIKEA